MTENETADYGRVLMEHLRMSGITEPVLGLLMAGYALATLVASRPEAPQIEDVLPLAISMVKNPPVFAGMPPVQN